jgi:hypothetical protein
VAGIESIRAYVPIGRNWNLYGIVEKSLACCEYMEKVAHAVLSYKSKQN